MKLILITMLIILNLDANIFESYKETKKIKIINSFKKDVSNANKIIKKGDYTLFRKYKNGIESTIEHVQKLDITLDEKKELKKDLQTYASIINDIYKKMHQKAPEFNKHYKNSIRELENFNKKLSSIGYRPLLKTWHKLSKIKARFIKKPSKKLEKKFNENYNLITNYITELYLDEEIEEPMFSYLKNYKIHFDEINIAYKSVEYENIKKIKPLSYRIKAKMEFLSPIEL